MEDSADEIEIDIPSTKVLIQFSTQNYVQLNFNNKCIKSIKFVTVMLTRHETQQVLCIDPTNFFLGSLIFKIL